MGRNIVAHDRTALFLGIGAGVLVAAGALVFLTGESPTRDGEVTLSAGAEQAGIGWKGAW